VLADKLGHFKHRHLLFAAENGLQFGVSVNHDFALLVLQVLFLDVRPKFFAYCGSRDSANPDHCTQSAVRANRLRTSRCAVFPQDLVSDLPGFFGCLRHTETIGVVADLVNGFIAAIAFLITALFQVPPLAAQTEDRCRFWSDQRSLRPFDSFATKYLLHAQIIA